MLLLAFVLYSSGFSYAVIGGWVGVDASTICRWLEPFSAWGWIWLQQQQFSFSGQVAVDEKHIKIGGVTWYLLVAVDSVTRMPLHINFYPPNGEWYCRTFLLELKAKGYRPYVIVTDGWDAYIFETRKNMGSRGPDGKTRAGAAGRWSSWPLALDEQCGGMVFPRFRAAGVFEKRAVSR
ncbi:MAG: DDE-type integrase/transposase/recombinase [bacterium]|nr:DDE-type integrase/transposase/recombinase [bacterium]